MIELGEIPIRDAGSVAEVRLKILGLARALRVDEVRATALATGVSEMARACVALGGATRLGVALDAGEGTVGLRLAWIAPGPLPDPRPLIPFFDRVGASDAPGGRMVTAFIETSRAGVRIDERFAARERERIQRKSRADLLEELRETNRQLERYNETLEETVEIRTAELSAANRQMRRDLDAGAGYVRSLIPAPIDGPVVIEWEYIPSSDLGGDTIGYHWIDDRHLALYLIDVTGHGLDSALLAVTIINVIRSGTLPDADLRRPDQVVASLNDHFQSSMHANKFFTIWYGVYRTDARELAWSGGGHHPSLLYQPGGGRIVELDSSGPLIGAANGMDFPAGVVEVELGARLLVFSDGAFEILRDGRLVWNYRDLLAYIETAMATEPALRTRLLGHVRALRGCDQLDDDYSVIEARFP